MTNAAIPENDQMDLPSDQDASGRSFGQEELDLLKAALDSGTLTSTKGQFVPRLEARAAEVLGARHAHACASGTAAVHCAVVAIDSEPGDEIITSPITDMGAITPIIYQGAIPVFADVDPATGNVTAETIRARLSEKTKAIVVTHLFGNPADMAGIMKVADAHNVPVIEDCAQAYMATVDGKPVGTFGAIGCFSLQQGKHITTGEGGLVITDDDALARRMYLFINKAWGYGDEKPDHYFLALNYRLTELQGAVAVAQFDKLAGLVDRRCEMAALLDSKLEGLPGIQLAKTLDGARNTHWKYCLWVDGAVVSGGPVALGGKLRSYNVASAPRYIQKPAFQCEILRDQRTFGNSRFPFTLARAQAVDYSPELFPGAFEMLDRVLVLPINENYTEEHVDYLARSIRAGHEELTELSEVTR